VLHYFRPTRWCEPGLLGGLPSDDQDLVEREIKLAVLPPRLEKCPQCRSGIGEHVLQLSRGIRINTHPLKPRLELHLLRQLLDVLQAKTARGEHLAPLANCQATAMA